MRKRTQLSLPRIALDRGSGRPLHEQMRSAIAEAIRSGGLGAGTRLPSTRVLAKLLGVSRNTVLAAYDALSSDGLIDGVRGSGVFVDRTQGAPGLKAMQFRRVLKEAHYPAKVVNLCDPDGTPLYLNP